MSNIKKIPGVINHLTDLTPTARAITIKLDEPLSFKAGSFVNLFIEHEGTIQRRAFSLSSPEGESFEVELSIRLNPKGTISPLFWDNNILGKKVEVMGPLGLNTADKMLNKNIFLFGFGIGAGVVKSLASHFTAKTDLAKLTIMTGNRSDTDVVHLDFFTELEKDARVTIKHVVSNPTEANTYAVGYIQNHISDLDFNHSDVYVCGQEVACQGLIDEVKKKSPVDCNFFVEGFH